MYQNLHKSRQTKYGKHANGTTETDEHRTSTDWLFHSKLCFSLFATAANSACNWCERNRTIRPLWLINLQKNRWSHRDCKHRVTRELLQPHKSINFQNAFKKRNIFLFKCSFYNSILHYRTCSAICNCHYFTKISNVWKILRKIASTLFWVFNTFSELKFGLIFYRKLQYFLLL